MILKHLGRAMSGEEKASPDNESDYEFLPMTVPAATIPNTTKSPVNHM